jgi:hypothetical protein
LDVVPILLFSACCVAFRIRDGESEMEIPKAQSNEQPPNGNVSDRERLELVRFPSADARRQAIGALVERGMLNFSSNREDVWMVKTSIARKLREVGVPFEWLSEHA